MADIVLINPRFEISYWGMEYALPFPERKRARHLPVACLPLLACAHARRAYGHHYKTRMSSRSTGNVAGEADIVGLTGMSAGSGSA